jgi:predicted DNA-binding protein
MKKLMIYLDEELHGDLKALAFRKRTTMAALVRYALDTTFEEEMDIIGAERALEEAARDPSSTMTLEEYLEKRGLAVPGRANAKGPARARRAAS